jgi:YHS domain-containing protein
MGPQRLFILAVLLYIAWRLIRNLLREKIKNELEHKQRSQEQEEGPVEDILEEDPVCHTLIPRDQALRLRQDGATYYFCSEACCDTFVRRQEGAKE